MFYRSALAVRTNVQSYWDRFKDSGLTRSTALLFTGMVFGLISVMFLTGAVDFILGGFLPEKVMTTISARGIQWGFGIFSLIYFWRTNELEFSGGDIREKIGLKAAAWVIGGLGIMIAVNSFSDPLMITLGLPTEGNVGQSPANMLAPDLSFAGILIFLFAYLLPTYLEESYYRGVVQNRLNESYGAIFTVVASAAMFGLTHGIFSALSGSSPAVIVATIIGTALAGLSFVIPYERTKNLLVVAVIHAIGWTEAWGSIMQSLV